MRTLFVGIDFDEGDQTSYRGVEVCLKVDGNKTEKKWRFGTGDPVVDWEAAIDWVMSMEHDIFLVRSSTDHFTMDGDQFRWVEKEGLDFLERTSGVG